MRMISAAGLLAIIFISITSSYAEPFAYAVGTIQSNPTQQDVLIKIDLSNGTAMQIGQVTDSITPATIYSLIGGLDIDPTTGSLYAVDDDTDSFLRIDPATGIATLIGSITSGGNVIPSIANMGFSFDGTGTLYFSASSGRRFSEMNVTTGDLTDIVTGAAAPNTSALAISNLGFFGLESVGDNLININPLDGTSTVIGAGAGIGFDVPNSIGLEFDDAGTLWGVEFTTGNTQTRLFTVDTLTGVGTLGSNVTIQGTGDTVNNIASLAIIPSLAEVSTVNVPLPKWTTIMMLLILMYLGSYMYKQYRQP